MVKGAFRFGKRKFSEMVRPTGGSTPPRADRPARPTGNPNPPPRGCLSRRSGRISSSALDGAGSRSRSSTEDLQEAALGLAGRYGSSFVTSIRSSPGNLAVTAISASGSRPPASPSPAFAFTRVPFPSMRACPAYGWGRRTPRAFPWWTTRSTIAAASLSSANTVPHLLNSMLVVNTMLLPSVAVGYHLAGAWPRRRRTARSRTRRGRPGRSGLSPP